MHRRSSAARLAVAALGLSIVTSMLAVIPAFAGDTRNVQIGSNVGDTIPVLGQLTNTPVSAGQAFLVSVRVYNPGPQNINNVQLQIGSDGNPLDESYSANVPDFPVALGNGATVASIVAGAPQCTSDADGPVVCTVGTLGKRKGFTATLLINAPTTGTLALKATVKVSENANDNGANTDTFAAEGAAAVLAPSCDGLFGYLPQGLAKQLSTTGLACDQAINLSVPQAATTKSDVVQAILTDVTGGSTHCGGASTCFGEAFEINVNGGSKVVGYIEVTLVWNTLPSNFNINKASVVHVGATKTVVIDTSKKSKCSDKKLTDCWTSSTVVDGTWTFTVRFPENGFIRGKG